jgi:vancomycin resistance protein YoaR
MHDAYRMTTIDEAAEPTRTTRTRTAWRVLAAFVIGFVLCCLAAGLALVAWDAGYEGRVLPGVSVGRTNVSGLDRQGATAALEAAYGDVATGRIVLRTTAGDAVVPYAAISRHAEIAAIVEEALATGRAGGPVERAIGQVRLARKGVRLDPRIALDAEALTAVVAAAVKPLDRSAVDARIWLDADGRLVVTPAQAGWTFDATAATRSAQTALLAIDAPSDIVIPITATALRPAHGEAAAMAAKAAFDRMRTKIAVKLGDQKWTLKAKTVRSWLRFGVAADGSPWPVADETAIADALKKIAKTVRRDAVSAKYLRTSGGRIVGVVAAKNGRKLDRAATATVIADALATRALGGTARSAALEMTKLPPKLTTAEALKKGPQMHKLGSWKTWFPISERNSFGANIWLPAKSIDGTVLMPGQRFEWWRAIGPVTTARGFGAGGFIAGDHTEPTGALGGGMCSSSTTLFNAALRAGLQMGARANHRYYIDRYPLGLDATVSKTRGGGVQTMSFTNDMQDPIVIRTFRYRSGGRGWVRYEIWGIRDGRTVSLSRPSVSNVRKAVTKTVYVSDLGHGKREQIEYPANGMDVSVTRVVRSAGGRVLHRDTYRTHYALWNGLIHVGR